MDIWVLIILFQLFCILENSHNKCFEFLRKAKILTMREKERWKEKELNQERGGREFPGGLVVRIWCFHCWGPGSIPGRGTEIPQVMHRKRRKERKRRRRRRMFPLFLILITGRLRFLLRRLPLCSLGSRCSSAPTCGSCAHVQARASPCRIPAEGRAGFAPHKGTT